MDSGREVEVEVKDVIVDDGNNEKMSNFELMEALASDHKYLSSKNTGLNSSLIIQREWRVLQRHLQDSIHVQVYESRMDLLRAVIIGAGGTPYHDGLFFFDIMLPADYPNQPPKVHYRSYGYRLNPNLYKNGMVCLSLINTWVGKTPEESWTNGSTLLQLLVSLQGLVLNVSPYFNEPMVIMRRGRLANNFSNAYTENAFFLSCWTMLSVFNRPPAGFESFVARHFRHRALGLIAAIQHYRHGLASVGRYDHDHSISSSSSKLLRVSKKLMSRLVDAEARLKRAFAAFITPEQLQLLETQIQLQLEQRRSNHPKDQSQFQKMVGFLKGMANFAVKIMNCGGGGSGTNTHN